MIVSINVPTPDSGMDPDGEIHAAEWLRDRMEGLRRDYLELFLPDSPDPADLAMR